MCVCVCVCSFSVRAGGVLLKTRTQYQGVLGVPPDPPPIESLYLYKNYAVRPSAFGLLRARPPCCRLRRTDDFARTVSKTDVLGLLAAKTASRRASCCPRQPPDGPPGAQDGLQTGFMARKTASDGPPGAPDGFRMGLLAPQTASDGPSPADKFTCRQDHLPTSQPWRQTSLRLHFSAAHVVLP